MSTSRIAWVGMTRQHFQPGRPGPVRALVIHATAGPGPGDLAWLRKGGDPARPVSTHYYIDKAGRISQLVRDEDTAWHAGRSTWSIDGDRVDPAIGLNPIAIGVELSNLNDGQDPYPEAQVASLIALARALTTRYAIPAAQLVRHLDISPGRKTDPAGFPWPVFVAQVFPATAAYSAESPILGPDRPVLAQAIRYMLARPHGGYSAWDIAQVILPSYCDQAAALGIDPLVAIAQMVHETGNLSSYWSQRPRRNPAGIGVTGQPGAGLSFADWTREAIPAHLGRLLAYALPLEAPTTLAQEAAIRYALRVRPLDPRVRGSAPILDALGAADNPANAGLPREQWIAGWAWDGEQYGEALARTANAIRSQPL